jgi:hypothetical protein
MMKQNLRTSRNFVVLKPIEANLSLPRSTNLLITVIKITRSIWKVFLVPFKYLVILSKCKSNHKRLKIKKGSIIFSKSLNHYLVR